MKLDKLLESTNIDVKQITATLKTFGPKNAVGVIGDFFSEIGLTGSYDFIEENKSRHAPNGVESSYDGEDVYVTKVKVESDGRIAITFTMNGLHYDNGRNAKSISWDDRVHPRNHAAFFEALSHFAEHEEMDSSTLKKYSVLFSESFGVDVNDL